MRTAKTLIRLGGCPGWSESSLGAQPFCWFCHVAGFVMSRLIYTRTQISKIHVYTNIKTIYPCISGSRNTRTYKSKRIHFEQICCLEKKIFCFCFVLKKKILALGLWEKKISVFLSEENLEEKTQPRPLPPRKSNGRSLNRFSRDVAHMVSCYFLVYIHCNKQYKKANKTDRYPFFNCHLYRHYRNSSHVSCRVILTCAKIRFVLKLDLR